MACARWCCKRSYPKWWLCNCHRHRRRHSGLSGHLPRPGTTYSSYANTTWISILVEPCLFVQLSKFHLIALPSCFCIVNPFLALRFQGYSAHWILQSTRGHFLLQFPGYPALAPYSLQGPSPSPPPPGESSHTDFYFCYVLPAWSLYCTLGPTAYRGPVSPLVRVPMRFLYFVL
jgi:hypothetical protein